jgi:uncharacterized protein
MTMHFLAKGLVIRALPGKGGKGVFAAQPFLRGDLLAVYGGIIVSGVDMTKLSAEEKLYSLQVDDDLHQLTPIDKVGGPDFINHSCEPNAGLSGTISLVALRKIQPDEEICFDYAMSDSHTGLDFECLCGTPTCRKFVRHDDWRRPDLQHKYRKAFSPYLLRRISVEVSSRRFAQAAHQGGAELHQDGGTLLD